MARLPLASPLDQMDLGALYRSAEWLVPVESDRGHKSAPFASTEVVRGILISQMSASGACDEQHGDIRPPWRPHLVSCSRTDSSAE